MRKSISLHSAKALIACLGFSSLAAFAQTPNVKVEGAWARVTVPGQKGGGAFMSLTAEQSLRLVGVSSPVAGIAEVHEMKMEGDIMKMRAVSALDLPAGKKVELKPGGYHLMLMDLKQPLRKDTQIPVTLSLQNAQGQTSQVEVSVPVMLNAPGSAGHTGHSGHSGHSGHGNQGATHRH